MSETIINAINLKEIVKFLLKIARKMARYHKNGLSFRIFPDFIEFKGGKILLDNLKVVTSADPGEDMVAFGNCLFYLLTGRPLSFADLLDKRQIQEQKDMPIRMKRILERIICRRIDDKFLETELLAIKKEIEGTYPSAGFRLNQERNHMHEGGTIRNPSKPVPLWTFNAGSRLISSPVAYRDVLYCASSDKKLFLLDKNTGELIKSIVLLSSVESTPAVQGNRLYIGDDEGNFYLIDIITGNIKITKNLDGSLIRSSPLATEKGVFIGTYNGNAFCLDSDSLEIKWRIKDRGWVYSSCALIRKRDAVTVLWDKGKAGVYRQEDGKALWESACEDTIRSTPVITQDSMIYGSFKGFLYILNTSDFSLLKKIELREKIFASPVVKDNLVITASMDKTVRCIDISRDKKHLVWSINTCNPVISSPVIYGDYVISADEGGMLYIIDISSGTVLGRLSMENFCRATPFIDSGILFTASSDKVFAFRL